MTPSRYTRAAAFALVLLMVFGLAPLRALADEGMFLPDAISQLPLDK